MADGFRVVSTTRVRGNVWRLVTESAKFGRVSQTVLMMPRAEGRDMGELWAPDDPEMDGTDGAHPAWWRGHDGATALFVAWANDVIDGRDDGAGVMGDVGLEALRRRLLAFANRPVPNAHDPAAWKRLTP